RETAVIVWRRGRVLLVQRPAAGRWAGMWEFPHTAWAAREGPEEAAERLFGELGVRADLGPELLTIKHAVTRFRVTVVCFEARFRGGQFRSAFYPQADWVRPEDLAAYPMSVPQRKLAQTLLQPVRQRRLF